MAQIGQPKRIIEVTPEPVKTPAPVEAPLPVKEPVPA